MSCLKALPAVVWLAVSMQGAMASGLPSDVVLPAEPLVSRADPNLAIDLALKAANAGAAYREAFDRTRTYEGYWDPMGCYGYERADGFFRRLSNATRTSAGAIVCDHRWSGNLLDWATTSSLDGLRLALTGGDRVVDDAARTVLQRAMLPAGFYRSGNFPDKAVTGHLDELTPLVGGGVLAADTVHFNNCLDVLMVGSSATGSCAAPGTDQSFGPGLERAPYRARVEVCSSGDVASRPWLCVAYPAGNHKPAGAIQRHAARMRFAVFGYLSDDDPARYGGVLRAPMKYAGPSKIDAAFDRVDNPQGEWDAATGIFKRDAELAGSVTGAINGFGRDVAAAAAAGTDGSRDPAGELYYESLRYLQGKAATPQAMTGIGEGDDRRKGGLPVFNGTAQWGTQSRRSAWDPAAGACRNNHILAIGDPDTQLDRSLPGLGTGNSREEFARAPDARAFEPDTGAWTRLVGAFENREALPYTHPSGQAGLNTGGNEGPGAFNYSDGTRLTSANIANLATGSDRGSFGVAGLALWAHTQRIRDDQPDARVRSFAIDIAPPGAATPQRLRGSAFYLAAKYGGFGDGNDDGNPFRASGGVGRPGVSGNAEWAEGLDGDGQPQPSGYFAAGDSRQLRAAIERVLVRSEAPAGGRSTAGALSSQRVTQAGAALYTSEFSGYRWSGTLLAYALTLDAATGGVRRAEVPLWDAGGLLTGSASASPPVPARDPATRRIFTLSGARVGIAFEWGALDDDLRGQLSLAPYASPAASDGLGPQRVAYLRGDRRKEESLAGGIFRVRDSVMGDIANASPLFVAGRPGRAAAVYVGANDGMLHAFSADSGQELFAYVPRAVFAGLAALTSPAYVHRSYVDGASSAVDAAMADGTTKTVLVTGNGGGATGVFALDVSDPAAFTPDSVMWEFGAADDPDMGRVTRAPLLLKFRIAAAGAGVAARYAWFAAVPSGYSNANPEKRAALFLLSLNKPAGATWKEGLNYHKILLPPPADSTRVNALGPPADQAGADGATRYLFAGDTQGNLWKFDFTGGLPWTSARVLGATPVPLMVAMDADGRRQPITIAPEVGVGPGDRAIVLFGTGQLASADDLGRASRGVQTLYAVYDSGDPIPPGAARLQLARRTGEAGGPSSMVIAGEPFAYGAFQPGGTARRGWFVDLPDSREAGERVVSALVLDSGMLYFNTLIPGPSGCPGDGGGRSCAVDAMTGLSPGGTCVPSGVGIPGVPLLVQAGEVVYGSADGAGRRTATRRMSVVNLGGGRGGAGVSNVEPVAAGTVSQAAGRLNWRQLADPRGGRP